MNLSRASAESDSSGEIDGTSRTNNGEQVEHLLGVLPGATTDTATPQGIQVLVKNSIPDRRNQFERSQAFFAEFLSENENLSLCGGVCQLFFSGHQRGWRGVERQLKLLRPSTNCPTIRVKMQVVGSGDCMVCAAFFPGFADTDDELYELLIAGNGNSSTWPNREPGHRPTLEEQASGLHQINLTKLRKRLRGNVEDVKELLEAIELYVGDGSRRVTPEVLAVALETALNVTMRSDADYMGVIRWLRENEYLYRENGEAYFLPVREESEPATEAESSVADETEGQDDDLPHQTTPTDVPVVTPATAEATTHDATVSAEAEMLATQSATPTTVDLMAELDSFEKLAREHRAHAELRTELLGRLDQLRTDALEKVIELQHIEVQIAALTEKASDARASYQRIEDEQTALESQVRELEEEGAKYEAVAARVQAVAALFTPQS